MPLSDEQRERIAVEFRAFVRRRIAGIEELKPENFRPNPFLAAVLGPELMASFPVNQRFERGVVTSFGTTLQNVARIVAGPRSGSGTGGADLEMQDNGNRYFVQIKSGPNTASGDIADAISDKLNSARARYGRGAVGVLGLCFGTLDEVHPIARKAFESHGIAIWAGKEFWKIISGGDEMMLEQVLAIAETVGEDSSQLHEAFRLKIDELSPIAEAAVDELDGSDEP